MWLFLWFVYIRQGGASNGTFAAGGAGSDPAAVGAGRLSSNRSTIGAATQADVCKYELLVRYNAFYTPSGSSSQYTFPNEYALAA